MAPTIIARWQDWTGSGLEHLILTENGGEIVADGTVIAPRDADPFAIRYRIVCDGAWRVQSLRVERAGSAIVIDIHSDGRGNWADQSSKELSQLKGAIDVDISATPFTNTLPIRRMNFAQGEPREILALYVQASTLTLATDRQRYTCVEPGKRYRYESVDSDFKRDIEVDRDGLVVNYPGLFRRVL